MSKKNLDEPYKKLPKGYSKQVGSSLSYWTSSSIYGFLGHPEYLRLAEYERALATDETIGTGIEFIKLSVQASLGEYYNSDPEIAEFVRANLGRMQGNYKEAIGQLAVSALWAGFGVSEVIYKSDQGKVWIDYIANYNPRTLTFHVNSNGILTEGEKAAFNSSFTTGIWQDRIGQTPVCLPLNRTICVTHNKRYNNYYGESALKRIYKNWRLKEAVLEMWNIALDRYGTPVAYAIVPNGFTGREVPDMVNPGKTRPETIADSTEAAIASIHTGTGLVIERPSPSDEISLGTLTTGNNFGEAFLSAIHYYNKAIFRGLLIPALLLQEQEKGSGSMGGGAMAQIHFEVFKLLLSQLYEEIVQPFVDQAIGRLIEINFGKGKDPGRFILSPYDAATAASKAELLTKLQEIGFVDNQNQHDINYFRVVCGLPSLEENEIDNLIALNKKMFDARIKQLTANMFAQQTQKELGNRNQDLRETLEKEKLELDKKKLRHDLKNKQQQKSVEPVEEVEEVKESAVEKIQKPIQQSTKKSGIKRS